MKNSLEILRDHLKAMPDDELRSVCNSAYVERVMVKRFINGQGCDLDDREVDRITHEYCQHTRAKLASIQLELMPEYNGNNPYNHTGAHA